MTKAVRQSVSKLRKKTINEEIISNNEPDYENNLFFQPKMTWNDFVDFCNDSKIGSLVDSDMFGEFVIVNKLKFYKSGNIRLDNIVGSITRNRTFEQYKEIIKNIYL